MFLKKKLKLKSYAKINLYLQVLNKRKDNFHNIRTIFEKIGLHDQIILESRRDKSIRITSNAKNIPLGPRNLAFRSAKLLQDTFGVGKGVNIRIIKRIPVGAGLGGGSSNAAAVLSGLNKLWRLKLSQSKLSGLGRRIGSDVPFFLYDTSFAQGTSRGDKIKPLSNLKRVKFWHILVVPKIMVSTPIVYKKWDRLGNLKLTKPKSNVKMLLLGLRKSNTSLIAKALINSLEEVTAKLYPEVRDIKDRLKSLGLKATMMSGSGPAVFSLISSRKEAVVLSRKVAGLNKSWQVFVSRTA